MSLNFWQVSLPSDLSMLLLGILKCLGTIAMVTFLISRRDHTYRRQKKKIQAFTAAILDGQHFVTHSSVVSHAPSQSKLENFPSLLQSQTPKFRKRKIAIR